MSGKLAKTKRSKKPAGFDVLEETLEALDQKMREAEMEDIEGKRRAETLWPIFRIHHQKSRYIYEMFYKKKKINREVYDYCIRQKIADEALIAKWKKQGYERLCCLQCMQPKDHNFGGTCYCRVPKKKRDADAIVECVSCGCRGCASGD
eukprot:gb/GEZN01019741.1/.p1 GENE.gb/GEZN01019741.1/~~gb/GEZN01019741.1/.p1  ORF type:complete len:149 (-),score=22.80 gb/GEZN01019741.1/:170-616(-)